MLSVLGEAALRTALLAGILQCMLSVLRVRRTRLLLAAWTIVLAISLAMPLLLRSSPVRIPLDEAIPRALIDGAADLMQPPSVPEPAGTTSGGTRTPISIQAWLEIAYAVIGCGLALRALLGIVLSLRILARASPIDCAWAVGMRVRCSRDVAGPVTIARTIVLPIGFRQWTTETRQAVLAHEHAHVARMDYAMLVVAQLNRALFWFSPLSWWLHRRLAVLTELVSDDQAIGATRDPIAYAEILLNMAQRPRQSAHGPSMARYATLSLRIDRILLDQVTSHRVGRLQWAALTLGMAAMALMVANVAPSRVRQSAALDPGDATVRGPEVDRSAPEMSGADAPTVPPDPSPSTVAPALVPTLQVKPAIRPRPEVRASTRTMVPRSAPRAKMAMDRDRNDVPPRSDVMTPEIVAAEPDRPSRPPAPIDDPALSQLDRLDGSTCVGTVTVGRAAFYQGGGLLQPDLKAGQVLQAKAQFFRKADASLWVRFGSFDRPPLDVKVRPTRTGVTWTGEYGITYAVQRTDGDHLVGLAAKIANDSAPLSFTCSK